jgi:hypothetical protein
MTWYFDIKTFKKQRQHQHKASTSSTHRGAAQKRGSIIQVQGRMAHNKMHIKGTIECMYGSIGLSKSADCIMLFV